LSRNVLAARNIEQLRSIAGKGALLAFDFDGTLAPLGTDPAATRMRAETSELFRALAHAAPVAVITGRSVHDAHHRLDHAALLALIGNHGAEPSPYAARAAREVKAWMPLLKSVVAALPGVVIEDKGQSVSVHYWHAPHPTDVTGAMEHLVPTLPHPVRLVHGIGLVNLIPDGAPDKGDAVRTLLQEHRLPAALFVGDELTDEAAFSAARASGGLAIRVGKWPESAANFHVATQLDIEALLTELLIGVSRARRGATLAAVSESDGVAGA
jgi:trehalose 6-phosphate phosphatase